MAGNKDTKSKSESIYSQLLRSIILITISATTALFIFSTIIFLNFFYQRQLSASNQKLELIYKQLEYYLSSIQHYSRLMVTNPQIQQNMVEYYQNKSISNNYAKINMGIELYRIAQPVPYIYSASIYDKSYKIVVTSERTPFKTKFPENQLTYGKWFITRKHKYDSKESIVTRSYLYPFYNYRSSDLMGYMELTISENSIRQIYPTKDSSDEQYLILDNENKIFSKSFSEDVDSKMLVNNSNKSHYFKYGNFINTYTFSPLNFKLVHIIPAYTYIMPALTFSTMFFIVTLICIIISIFISRRVAKNITKPIYKLIDHTQSVKKGEWSTMQNEVSNADMRLLISEFNDMIKAQKSLQESIINSEKEKNKIQMRFINEQIKPHFLYNTLDNIYSLAELDEKEILLKLVLNLSKFYRSTLSFGKAFISIKEELDNLEAYLNIMSIRYIDKFNYNIQRNTNLDKYKCPKLLLQPIAENAIQHGIIPKFGTSNVGISHIEVSVFENDSDIIFQIKDDGVVINDIELTHILKYSASNKNFALRNINQMLKFYYGDEYGIEIISNKGCTVKLKIKKEKLDENSSS